MKYQGMEFDVEEDKLVFKATLDKWGVQVISKKQDKVAESFIRKHGRTLKSITGNFEKTCYIFTPGFTEEEYDALG